MLLRSFVHCTLTFIAWLTLYNTWHFTFYSVGCTRNEDCHLTEACINNACQHPCAIHNTCALNAVCINTNHGSDCSCAEGYQGNGYVGCVPGNKSFIIHSPSKCSKWLIICYKCPVLVMDSHSVCQYNEDCPPELLCDRLNRVCINPCSADKCGDNAECVPSNHGIECKCYAGYTGNPFLECYQGKTISSSTVTIYIVDSTALC